MGNNSINLQDNANNNNNSSLYQTDGNSNNNQQEDSNNNTVPLLYPEISQPYKAFAPMVSRYSILYIFTFIYITYLVDILNSQFAFLIGNSR